MQKLSRAAAVHEPSPQVEIRRGEVWWARLPEPTGSEPGWRRPVLIVQSDEFNRSRVRTVIALALSANAALETAPGNVLLRRRASGLPRDSVVNVSQFITLDRELLERRVRAIPRQLMFHVEAGLRLVLELHDR